ncbi:MAG: nucleotide exchange factor GrpE [Bacillota bacterium]
MNKKELNPETQTENNTGAQPQDNQPGLVQQEAGSEETSRQVSPDIPGEEQKAQSVEGEKPAARQVEELAARVAELEGRLAEAETRAQEYWNRLVRLQADFENYRKRSAREREEFGKFAAEQLITELLPVVDNFERALAAGRENPSGFYEGVEMIYRQFADLLKSQGLTAVPAVGEKFDPCRHEAVAWEETNEESADNIILKEFRKGYCLKDKIIRPAMVVVARVKQNEVQEGEEVDG